MAAAAGLAALPDEFDLPHAFRGGDPVIVDLNWTLAGFYGAMSQHITSIRGRDEMAGEVHDLASFNLQTDGLIEELDVMRTEARRQAQVIVLMGGIPFPIPDILNEAMNELLPEAAVALGGLGGQEVPEGNPAAPEV